MAERRFYWLKLKEDFFESKRIKKLRRLAGGDTLTIIYLKMQLKSIKTDGVLRYTGLEKSFAEELALDLDENPEDVGLLLNYLLSVGLIETSDNINFLLPYAVESTGSEGASAERVRNFRERQALLCNVDVTEVKRIGNVEIEKEIEIDKEKENKGAKRTSRAFTPPTYEEVKAYCDERKNGINPQHFIDYYQARGWVLSNGKKMVDYKAAIRTWEQRNKPTSSPQDNEMFKKAIERMKK